MLRSQHCIPRHQLGVLRERQIKLSNEELRCTDLSNTLCCATETQGIVVTVRYAELTLLFVDGVYENSK